MRWLWGGAIALGLLAAPAWADAQDDLIRAAGEGHAAMVNTLLKTSDINAPDRSGQTPLIAAARHGQMEMVQLLLNHGASVTVRDWKGKNALMWAQDNGHSGVVELLKHQQAFATAYLGVLGKPGTYHVWNGTLVVDYAKSGTTHMVYTRPGLTVPVATMVARSLAGPGLNYGDPVLDGGWITFPALKLDVRTKAQIKSWGYSAQQVEVWLQ